MSHLVRISPLPNSTMRLYRLMLGDLCIREQVSAFSEDDIKTALREHANPTPFQPVKDDTWATKPGPKPKRAFSINRQDNEEIE